jgi:threonine dehydrogenase-like Zn-dependent dehydrogenase
MCANCRKGDTDRCSTGNFREHGIYQLHGFASERAVTGARYLVKVPKEIEGVAVLLEPLSVAESAIEETYRIQQRMEWAPSKALVVGAGPLGLLASMVLRLRGLEVHTAATRSQESLKAEIVRQIGGRYIDVGETPLSSISDGYDILVEATGSVEASMSALPRIRRNGAVCILGLYGKKEVCEGFGNVLTRMVLDYNLMFGSVSSKVIDFERGVEDMKALNRNFSGALSRMITTKVPPEDYRKALEPDREDIKAVIGF